MVIVTPYTPLNCDKLSYGTYGVVIEDHNAMQEPLVGDDTVCDSSIRRIHRSHADAAKSYDCLSTCYDCWSGWEWPYIKHGLRVLALKPGETCVEIGCGTGKALYCICSAVSSGGAEGSGTGHDISAGMVEKTVAHCSTFIEEGRCTVLQAPNSRPNPNLNLTPTPTPSRILILNTDQTDATKLPHSDGAFDAAFSSFVLELFDTPELVPQVKEVSRVLKEDGRAVFVSMSKVGEGGCMMGCYECCHSCCPSVVDCRPIFLARIVREAGLMVESVEEMPMYGLCVEVVLARKVSLPPSNSSLSSSPPESDSPMPAGHIHDA